MTDEISGEGLGLDLFGRQIEPIRDRRGRPSFAKTKENQSFVAVRIADGWSHKRIAEDMGIDEKTLRKYFSRELENGVNHVRGEILDVLQLKLREGHVPSIRLLIDMMEKAGTPAPRAQRPAEAPAPDPNRPLGKKEIAVLEAQNMPDDYGDIFDRRKARH